MRFKEMLSRRTGVDEKLLPASYQIIGDVLLLKFLKINSLQQKKMIAKAIMDIFPRIKTVCEILAIKGEYRTPKIRNIAGDGLVTIHKEHGILFMLDVSKIMFSKGNLYERQRIVNDVKKNEIIIDMFAGIGYFSLGIAKKAKKVYAIEKNKVAFRYLKENIRLNKIKNIVAINADCRNISLPEKATRVIMGYFPRTEKFLPYALKFIDNGIIHFHNIYRSDELWHKPLNDIEKACKRPYKILSKRKVKSIAPRTYHITIDFSIG